jgi:hypothetical protein
MVAKWWWLGIKVGPILLGPFSERRPDFNVSTTPIAENDISPSVHYQFFLRYEKIANNML